MKPTPLIKTYEFQGLRPDHTFDINRMEHIFDKVAGKIDVPHRHDYYTVIWVEKGKGYHLIDFNQYPLGENQIFFVGPGQIHQLNTVESPIGRVMTFSNDFLNDSGIDKQFLLKINLATK
jgi:AraC family transcriptional regulator, transcriptional activator of pobA